MAGKGLKTLDPCLRRDDEKETMSIIRASLPLMWESSVLCVTYVTGLYQRRWIPASAGMTRINDVAYKGDTSANVGV